VKVATSGDGIPAEVFSQLMERRYLPSISAGENSGFNVSSLSELYNIVGTHGGRVFVNNKAGEGSTILFTLPAITFDENGSFNNEQAINSGRR
jgi:signal transduction histidine kinase